MKNYLIVIALLLICQFNFAKDSDSSEYIKAVDYVTCICINDALPDNQKKFDCINEKVDLKYVTDSKTIELFNELQNLKKKPNVGSDYSKFLTEEIFNDEKKLTKIYAFATSSRRAGAKMDKIKSDIKAYIKNNTSNTDVENKVANAPHSESDVADNNQSSAIGVAYKENIRENKSNFENSLSLNFNVWIAILFVIFSLITFLIWKRYRVLDKKIEKLNSMANKKVSNNELTNSFNQYNHQNTSGNNNNDREFKEIKRRLEYLEDSFKNLNSPTIFKDEASPEVLLEIPKANIPQTIVFYMATPNKEDGSFDISSQTESFKPTQSLYKFKVNNSNSSKASFGFFSDEAGKRDSIDSPQTYIDPVCEPQNARNPNAKEIITTYPGSAEKRNDRWIVTTKAKIKYE